MPEESTTSDLVELSRRAQEAGNRRDVDEAVGLFAPDAVWDLSPMDFGVSEGRTAIRGFLQDWPRTYGDLALEVEEILNLGSGVGFEVFTQRGAG